MCDTTFSQSEVLNRHEASRIIQTVQMSRVTGHLVSLKFLTVTRLHAWYKLYKYHMCDRIFSQSEVLNRHEASRMIQTLQLSHVWHAI